MASFIENIRRARQLLREERRISLAALKLDLGLDDARLESLIQELVSVQGVARRDGTVLAWADARAAPARSEGGPGQRESSAGEAEDASADLDERAERRQLTVLFCDLVESTDLASQLDAESYREVLRAYQDAVSAIVTRYAGHVAQYLGDGVLVYFGWPHAHEDDAERAVRAALSILPRIASLNERFERLHATRIQVRVSLHTGPVVVGAIGSDPERAETLATGETTNVAARLQTLAAPDAVVLSDATLRLVQGIFVTEALGEQRLKGVAAPVHVYRALRPSGMRSRLEVAASSGLTPFVGRDQELMLLEDRWTQSREDRGQAVLLSGEAGIGKSRLMQAFRERVAQEPHTWLECRTSPYTQDSALAPILELHRQAMAFRPEDPGDLKLARLEAGLEVAGFDLEAVVPLMAALHSVSLLDRYASPDLSPDEQRKKTFDVLTEWLLRLARQQPVIFLVEDLHWADPSTLELLGRLLEQLPTAGALLVLSFRPDFTPPWPTRADLTPMLLSRLTRGQLGELVRKAAGGRRALPHAWIDEIIRQSDGVPLFAEEITKAVLEANPDTSTVGATPRLRIPETLQDSLMARLDALGPVKELAQVASILGREFEYELLATVSPLREAALNEGLAAAVREEVFYQRGSPPEALYVFRHALLRDAAYESMLQRVRQSHHRRVAESLVERMPEIAVAQPELVAHHWTEARETERAILGWWSAGEHAAAHSAHREAAAHLRKGLALLEALPESDERDRRELAMQITLGTSLIASEGYASPEVERPYTRARELCGRVDDAERLGFVLWGLASFHTTRGDLATGAAFSEELSELGTRTDNPVFVVTGEGQLGWIRFNEGRLADAVLHETNAVESYEPAQAARIIAGYGQDFGIINRLYLAWALWVQGHPDQAADQAQQAIRLARPLAHPFTLAFVLTFAAHVYLMRRDEPMTVQLADEAISLSEKYGFPLWVGIGKLFRGWARRRDGGFEEAREGAAATSATGNRAGSPIIMGILAETALAGGHSAEAMDIIDAGLAISAQLGMCIWDPELHRLKGVLLGEGDGPPREAELTHALAMARELEARSLELRAARSLAALWLRDGKRNQARELLRPVYDRFAEGLATQDLRDAKGLLEELG